MRIHSKPDSQPDDRRPLRSRETLLAQRIARYLAGTSITANQVSFASIVVAIFACSFFVASSQFAGWMKSLCYLLAALSCQLRLFCNLMDGMIAIESGKQTPDGAVWNELPDRIADVVIFVGVGFAVAWPSLGWAVATLAVFISYVRELGKGLDGVVDFSGPMAKPHRMALVSAAAVVAAAVNLWSVHRGYAAEQVLLASLWVIVFGCLITIYRRTRSLLLRL